MLHEKRFQALSRCFCFSKGDPGDKARIPAQDSVLVKTVERIYGMQASNNAFLRCVNLLVDLQIVAIIKRFYIMEYASNPHIRKAWKKISTALDV